MRKPSFPLQTTGLFFGETYRQATVNGLTLSENRYVPAQITPRHTHEAMLFYFILEGLCQENATTGESVHPPSTLVFLPAGEHHSTRWSPDSNGLCFHLELTDSYWHSRRIDRRTFATQGPNCFSRGALPALMRRLYAEFLRWDTFSSLIAEGIVLEMLGELARRQAPVTPHTEQWLSTVEASLRENFTSPPTLTELADSVGIHPSHLVRAFRRRYNVPPGEFIRQIRIEEACRRLRSTPDLSLAALAVALGFADQSHFTRTFHRQVGVSPGAYRRTYTNTRT